MIVSLPHSKAVMKMFRNSSIAQTTSFFSAGALYPYTKEKS